jgi:hypothetical protein
MRHFRFVLVFRNVTFGASTAKIGVIGNDSAAVLGRVSKGSGGTVSAPPQRQRRITPQLVQPIDVTRSDAFAHAVRDAPGAAALPSPTRIYRPSLVFAQVRPRPTLVAACTCTLLARMSAWFPASSFCMVRASYHAVAL